MSTHEQSRRAHELVDAIKDGYTPDRADVDFLRSFLPELPKQKTLEEIIAHVYDVWIAASGDEWGGDSDRSDISLEDWLSELQVQLKGLNTELAKPAHPEFLETEADYQNAPEGTIVACDDSPPCHKFGSEWSSVLFCGMKDDRGMSRAIRRVLRWGNE